MKNFDDCFDVLMGVEKGYSNNPDDPGGETMWGVTARVARENGYTGDMKDLPRATAKCIAKSEYWDKYLCDQFSINIGFQVFDCAYNGGHPAQWLQRAAGVTEDGVIGAQTIAAVRASDPDKIIMRFDAYRLHYMADLKNRPTFAGGWMHRIADNLLRGAEA
jgi:lysozyme family protein